MDFNLDDPLADLVSDNSNDSFFETSKNISKTVTKSKDDTKLKKTPERQKVLTSNKMEDLFGISSEVTKATKLQMDNKSIKSSTPPSVKQNKSTISRQEISKSEDLFNESDIIADLGFDPKKPKAMKSNILDDLFTSIESSKTTNKYSRPSTAGGGVGTTIKNISRQSTETTDYSGTVTSQGTSLPTTRPKTSIGRRQSANSTNDPLGLFTNPIVGSTKDHSFESKLDLNKEVTTKQKTNINPDWLGLDIQSHNIKKSDPKEINTESQILQINHSQLPITTDTFLNQQLPQIPSNMGYSNQNALVFASANMETQNTIQALNQQESQIMMAVQLKNQETALMEMQKKQQELINQQELKFNELLQKQISRQNFLETTIKSQQERINAHIHLLMTQPGLITNQSDSLRDEVKNENNTSTNIKNENPEMQIQLEHEVKRLELDKLRLEDVLSNINTNHEKEMQFIENSHKKQIQLLEENLELVQKRLQSEISSVEEFYKKKLTDLVSEKENLVDVYEEKIKVMKTSHDKFVEDLKLNYEMSIKSLKNDHKSTIEAIRESKLMEFAFVQDNSSYLQILRNASNNLENASGNLQTLRDEMYNKIDMEYKEKEENLAHKEKKLNDMERRLKFSEEKSEREKERLIELVTTLEIQLEKLSKDSSDEQWNLKQKLSTIEVERAALEREKEFIREKLNRDEKRIEELKQSQLNDYQNLMCKLEDEKNLLAIEKSKFETSKKLEQNSDFNKSKSEIEISIKVAKDATKQADLERERYLKLQREIEIGKRGLVDQENELRSKSEELEAEIFKTKGKEQKIQEALRRQKFIEQSLNAKLQFLQNQTIVLSERETQLSQERLNLSKERIELQDFKRKIELNKCSLCKIGERSTAISNIITGNDIFPDAENYKIDHNSAYNLRDILNNGNNVTHNIDEFFDRDVTDSLRKMEHLNKKLSFNMNDDLNNDLITQNMEVENPQSFLDPNFSTIEFNSIQSKND